MADFEVNLIRKGKRLVVVLNGSHYTLSRLASFLKLSASTVYHKNNDSSEEVFILWIKKKLWLKSKGLNMMSTVLHKDNFFTTTQIIADTVGIKQVAASKRWNKFKVGLITREELFENTKRNSEECYTHRANWGDLRPDNHPDNITRVNNIKNIQKPTKYDKILIHHNILKLNACTGHSNT